MTLESTDSEDPRLISDEIILEVFQHCDHRTYLNVTDRWTDGELHCRGITATANRALQHRGVKTPYITSVDSGSTRSSATAEKQRVSCPRQGEGD